MGTYIADNGEIIRGGQEDDGFELNPETPIFNPPKGLHNIGDGKTIDYATPTGDKIRNENAIEENDLGKICEDTCKIISVYRTLLYLIPMIGIPVGITVGNGVSSQLIGISNTSSKVLSAIAAVTMSKIAVRIVRKSGREQTKRIIGREDNEDDGKLKFYAEIEDGKKIIIEIDAKDILNLAIVAGGDAELLKKMIMQMIETKKSEKIQTENATMDENEGKTGINAGSIKRHSLENSKKTLDYITKKFKEEIKNIDIYKINSFLSSVIFRLLQIPSLIKFPIKKIYTMLFKMISDNKKDAKDGKKDGMIDGVPVDVHIILKNITGDNTELYNSLKEIYNERQEELKPHIEYLNQSFEDKTLKQKIADLLRKNNWLMKVWFIKDFVTQQALALPPGIKTDLYRPVYNKYGEIIGHEVKNSFKEELSQNGELQGVDTNNNKPTIILDEKGYIRRVYSREEI